MARVFNGHLERLDNWLTARPNVEVLKVDYNGLVSGGIDESVARINDFLGGSLDLPAMAAVVEPDLYHQREGS
jgi:hypothetical protein